MVAVQETQPAPMPLVVRVDEVDRAVVVDYRIERASLDQNDPVVGYFLNSSCGTTTSADAPCGRSAGSARSRS